MALYYRSTKITTVRFHPGRLKTGEFPLTCLKDDGYEGVVFVDIDEQRGQRGGRWAVITDLASHLPMEGGHPRLRLPATVMFGRLPEELVAWLELMWPAWKASREHVGIMAGLAAMQGPVLEVRC